MRMPDLRLTVGHKTSYDTHLSYEIPIDVGRNIMKVLKFAPKSCVKPYFKQNCNTFVDMSQELEYCKTVVLSVTDEQGLYTIMDELLPATRNNHPGMRRAAVTFLFVYCSQTKTGE